MARDGGMPRLGLPRGTVGVLRSKWRRASRLRKTVTVIVSVVAIVITIRAIIVSPGDGTPFGNEVIYRIVQLAGTIGLYLFARRALRR